MHKKLFLLNQIKMVENIMKKIV